MALESFLQEYFINPIVNPAYQGYNPVNTLVYGAILLGMAFFVVFPILDRRGVKFGEKFAIALIPLIFFGAAVRAISAATDAGMPLLPGLGRTPNPLELGFWTFTPGIWFTTFIATIAALLISRIIAKKTGQEHPKILAAIGAILAIPFLALAMANFSNWAGFLGAVAMVLAIVFVVVQAFSRFTKSGLMKGKLNILAMAGQAIDGSSTFVAISFYGFGEMHPVSAAILSVNPLLFVLVKIALVIAILWYVERNIKGKNLKGFIKVFLMILGFATGGAGLLKLGLFG